MNLRDGPGNGYPKGAFVAPRAVVPDVGMVYPGRGYWKGNAYTCIVATVTAASITGSRSTQPRSATALKNRYSVDSRV
jgi:hypothetical protein